MWTSQNDLPIRIGLDAMGGDFAPAAAVEGAALALRSSSSRVVLFGDPERLAPETASRGIRDSLEIRAASEVVGMDEPSATPLRRKRNASIRVAIDALKEGDVAAVVSAGHTGATMAAATVVLGTLPGIERPAIAALVPHQNGHSVLIDAGATIDCKAEHLLHFAVMGSAYARWKFGTYEPSVGLLSIGEEAVKGNDLTREAHRMLGSSGLPFVGNLEGRDVFQGAADVVVCDGFIGNVALKISEGLADALNLFFSREIDRSVRNRIGYALLKPVFQAFRRRVDYSEYGGAPLLGVKGVVVISHGRSSAKAIGNALRVAEGLARANLNERIVEWLARYVPTPAPPAAESGSPSPQGTVPA